MPLARRCGACHTTHSATRCPTCAEKFAARSEAARPSARERGYTSRWRRARAAYLSRNPLCRTCRAAGLIVPSTVVDHVTAHRGDAGLMWEQTNWQALCKPCHDKKTSREDGGFGRGQSRRIGKVRGR